MDNMTTAFRIIICILDILFGLICFNGGTKDKDPIAKKGAYFFTFLLIMSAMLIRF